MKARRSAAAAVAALMVLGLVGCGGASPDGRQDTPGAAGSSSQAATETWDLLVLADSSGWGVAEVWADLIRRDYGVEVKVHDFATGLQSGEGLLKHLTTEGDPQREAVREAEVISVWGSPASMVWKSDLNDCYIYPNGTRPPTRISRRDLEPYAEVWYDILAEINFLRNGQPTALRTRDIYNPVVANHIAAGTGAACTAGAWQMTLIVREATRRAGGTFVPVYRTFNGPDGMQDARKRGHFMDMEHLSDKGVALIARLHHEAGYAELTQERPGPE